MICNELQRLLVFQDRLINKLYQLAVAVAVAVDVVLVEDAVKEEVEESVGQYPPPIALQVVALLQSLMRQDLLKSLAALRIQERNTESVSISFIYLIFGKMNASVEWFRQNVDPNFSYENLSRPECAMYPKYLVWYLFYLCEDKSIQVRIETTGVIVKCQGLSVKT